MVENLHLNLNDGTIKECNNVWCQGEVKDAHPHWQEIHKDNAVIL